MPAMHPRYRVLMATLVAAAALAGCAGGPIARQIASSIASQTADRIVSDYVDAELLKEPDPPQLVLPESLPDEDQIAFLMADLPVIRPPAAPRPAKPPEPEPSIRVSKLIPVEIRNFIVGAEKEEILSRHFFSQPFGSMPTPQDWGQWQLAEGIMIGHRENPLQFLVPPELGKMRSGDRAVVEFATAGKLHLARDRLD
jgi:hypothetical protein